jgi:hypothetical protein
MLVVDTDSNVAGHIPLLKSKGVAVVGRYFSASSWKRISAGEAQEIAAGSPQLFTIFENSGDPTPDCDAGTSDAQPALQQVGVIGQPLNSARHARLYWSIAVAWDWSRHRAMRQIGYRLTTVLAYPQSKTQRIEAWTIICCVRIHRPR